MQQDMLGLVYTAIDEVNAQSVDGAQIPKTPEGRLLGKGGVDSLTFVNLVVAVEEQVQNSLGKTVVLVDENSMAAEDQPFRTVGSMAIYLGKMIARQ